MYEHGENADLLHTIHTVLISQLTNCSMSSAHERFERYMVQREMLLECLCMNLNFKLLFFFIKSTDLFWEKSYVNIWFISYPGNERFMCGHSVKSDVYDWRVVLRDWGPSTQIWISAFWMYYSSVLNLVQCPSAWLFNLLRCHFFIYYFLQCIGPCLILVTPGPETADLLFGNGTH